MKSSRHYHLVQARKDTVNTCSKPNPSTASNPPTTMSPISTISTASKPPTTMSPISTISTAETVFTQSNS